VVEEKYFSIDFEDFRRTYLYNVYNKEEMMTGDVTLTLVRKKETNYLLIYNSLPQKKREHLISKECSVSLMSMLATASYTRVFLAAC